MEAKVNQVQKILFFSKFTVLPRAQRFCLESLEHNRDLLRKRLQGLTGEWKFRVQEQWKDHYSSQQCLVHIVKEGETLTSISRLYGLSVQSIAVVNEKVVNTIAVVNEKVVNIHLVYEGQRLHIPSLGFNNAMKDFTRKTRFYCFSARDRCQRALNILGGQGNHKIFTLLSSHHLQPVKTNGPYLVLVPLIAFCIRCIISAFQYKVGEDLKRRVVNESNAHQYGSRSIRWKTALSDIRELDVVDAKSEQDSIIPPEDQPPVSFEEMSHAYTKMEPAYQKFLSECGMSDSGYWRGGSPE